MKTEMKFYARPDGVPFDNDGRSWVAMKKDGKFTLIRKDGAEEPLVRLALQNKEIEYPPHWPNAFKYRWEPLSTLPAPSGYVYVGKGGENELALSRYFGNNPKSLYSYDYGEFKENWSGIDQNQDYYVPRNVWNETFKGDLDPINKKENTNKIKTKADPAARELVEKMCAARWEGEWKIDSHYAVWTLGNESGGLQVSNEYNSWHKDYKEVPLHEFIFELGKIPEKEKEKEINILPWRVVIRGEKCDFGCKKDISVESVKTFLENLPSYYGNMDMLGKKVKFGKNGFQADGETVSWEKLEAFKKEFEK